MMSHWRGEVFEDEWKRLLEDSYLIGEDLFLMRCTMVSVFFSRTLYWRYIKSIQK